MAMVAACGGDAGDPGASAAAAAPTWGGSAPLVMYGATRQGRTDLYVADPDGHERRVVGGELSEVQPRLAPDGLHLIFHARNPGAPYGLYRATPGAPDTGAPPPPPSVEPLVVEEGAHALGGVWSPDGESLAYFSTRGEAPPTDGGLPGHIWIRHLATGADRRLTVEPLTGTLGPSDWSPDGGWVLAARPFDGQLDVVRIDVATGAEERLTRDLAGEYGAAYSHDGRRVAFHAETEDSAWITVLDLDSGERRALTSGPGWRYSPVWSPDDAWLLVTAVAAGGEQTDVVAIRVNDGLMVPVAASDEDERYGAWVPRESPWVKR
jgi:Tol biopolymer transport system component